MVLNFLHCINLLKSFFFTSDARENSTYPLLYLILFLAFKRARTVEVLSLFFDFVLMIFTEENILSTLTLACGKLNKLVINPHNVLNCGHPAPSVISYSLPQNSSGSSSSFSNGSVPMANFRHSSSSFCKSQSETIFGKLAASGTRERNFE